MLSRIRSASTYGVDAYIVEVETDIAHGVNAFVVVGLPDAAVKESRERVESAIKNTGYLFPFNKRTAVNLAPADIKKEGTALDLPIAIGILASGGQIPQNRLQKFLFLGELSLDGSVRPVKGALPIALCAKKEGIKELIVSVGNAKEAAVVEGVSVYGVESLAQTVSFLTGECEIEPTRVNLEEAFRSASLYDIDFSDVKGQGHVKESLEVAAAGAHNILLIGPPGAGKTMLAKRLPSILPPMMLEEAIETTKIFSVAGYLDKDATLVGTRPFRSPHHTVSYAGLIGGGTFPTPGEVSLAHNGVLYLDELPEFKRDVLEMLRQPLEDREVTISRVARTVTFPSSFMLVAAMNPCPCGFFNSRTIKPCSCTQNQIRQYLSKISGPLLDRIDIHLDVPAVPYKDLADETKGEPSDEIAKRVARAREHQLERFKGRRIYFNSHMERRDIEEFCKLKDDCRRRLEDGMKKYGLSARAYDRILKMSRTIADLADSDEIEIPHISKAIHYRTLELWGFNL